MVAREERPPGRAHVGGVHRGERALMDFHGQHIVVTGGSSGLGLVSAQLLASRGARVSLIARRKALLDEAVAGIGECAAGFAADVSVKAELDAALDAAAAHFGPVHGLFANAGLTGGFTPAVAFDSDVFEQTIKVNLTDRKSTRLNSSHSQISYAVF